jgi:hypothetical protein
MWRDVIRVSACRAAWAVAEAGLGLAGAIGRDGAGTVIGLLERARTGFLALQDQAHCEGGGRDVFTREATVRLHAVLDDLCGVLGQALPEQVRLGCHPRQAQAHLDQARHHLAEALRAMLLVPHGGHPVPLLAGKAGD